MRLASSCQVSKLIFNETEVNSAVKIIISCEQRIYTNEQLLLMFKSFDCFFYSEYFLRRRVLFIWGCYLFSRSDELMNLDYDIYDSKTTEDFAVFL